MSMEFVNRICPNCWSPNYMVLLGDFSKAYKYKCMNCNRYFNDIDLEYYNNQTFKKKPLRSVWKSECMNTKVDMVEVVRCKDCKYRPKQTKPPKTYGLSIEFPEESVCPCQCDDGFYSWYPADNWFCADGKRKESR